MSSEQRYGGPGGWSPTGEGASLRVRVREVFEQHPARAQTSFVARALGVGRGVVYSALVELHAARMVSRRPDGRGRVWWFPRVDVGLVRKERIVFALDRARDGQLPTSQLGRAWGETDARRAYVARRRVVRGLSENRELRAPAMESVWRRADTGATWQPGIVEPPVDHRAAGGLDHRRPGARPRRQAGCGRSGA